MNFSAREDIGAPIEHVFGSLTDFDNFERQALRRGAEVSRQDPMGAPGVGTIWQIRFTYRGKTRDATARIDEFDAPNGFGGTSKTAGIDGNFRVDLVVLSPRRTRMTVALELTPKSLAARLLMQSLKFARSRLTNRFQMRVKQFGEGVEEAYHAQS